jgi:5-methylcytosine-specific restriction protein A
MRIKDLVRKNTSKRRKRSSRWRSVRKEHLAINPSCAVCGSTKKLEVHHIVPFHVNPKLELSAYNLLTLCDGMWGLNCHFVFGHLRNWRKFNQCVVTDAQRWLRKLTE